MGWIQKRERKKGTVYRAIVRIKGLPQQQKTFARLTDAKMWIQQTEANIRTGEFQNIVKTAATKTLRDVIDRYRQDVQPHKAESTQRAEKTYVAYWERTLGGYSLSYIDAELVSAKLKELMNSGDARRKSVATKTDTNGQGTASQSPSPVKKKSRKTIKHYRDILAVLFNHAKSWGWVGKNTMDDVSRIIKANKERVRFLDDDERKALLTTCKASPNKQLYPVVVFALSTGARKSEVLKLKLRDLDLERQVAILRETKNRETRKVPIVSYLKGVIEEHLKWRERYLNKREIKSDYLFPRSDGKGSIDIRKAWENARDKAGIIDFRFHDLRHSAASYLAMNGASQLEIAEVLGHKTLQMVKRYSHLSEDHTRDVVEKMNDKIFEMSD